MPSLTSCHEARTVPKTPDAVDRRAAWLYSRRRIGGPVGRYGATDADLEVDGRRRPRGEVGLCKEVRSDTPVWILGVDVAEQGTSPSAVASLGGDAGEQGLRLHDAGRHGQHLLAQHPGLGRASRRELCFS